MKKHEFDVVSFLLGLVLTGVGAVFLLTDSGFAFLEARWLFPSLLVVGGIAVLLAGRRHRTAEPRGVVDPGPE